MVYQINASATSSVFGEFEYASNDGGMSMKDNCHPYAHTTAASNFSSDVYIINNILFFEKKNFNIFISKNR